ncbi:MAG: hypothetical protein LC687_01070 [Actinobacteria bacterium]|nr:hypothetical protein [Actinomycetota bacterium]
MAYETGAATTPDGLLDALRLFAIAQGWTVNKWEEQIDDSDPQDPISTGYWLNLSKGTQFVSLVSDKTGSINTLGDIIIRGATGFSSTPTTGDPDDDPWQYQPGGMTGKYDQSVVNDLRAGAYVAHHFFAEDQYIHCVVEVQSGRYTHFGFGVLDKSGTYDGGEYHFGYRHYLDNTSYSGDGKSSSHAYPFSTGTTGTFVRFTENDLDGTYLTSVAHWAEMSTSVSATDRYLRAVCWVPQTTSDISNENTVWGTGIHRQPNYFNGTSMLIPFTIACGRRYGLTAILGAPKDIAYINIQNIPVGQEITLGSDTWMTFPFKQKGVAIPNNTTPFSWYHGIAYRKIV